MEVKWPSLEIVALVIERVFHVSVLHHWLYSGLQFCLIRSVHRFCFGQQLQHKALSDSNCFTRLFQAATVPQGSFKHQLFNSALSWWWWPFLAWQDLGRMFDPYLPALFFFFYHPPPPSTGGRGIYLNHFVCLSDCVHSVFPELLNLFFFLNQIWYSGVLAQGDVSCRKNWFTILNVKVTARS